MYAGRMDTCMISINAVCHKILNLKRKRKLSSSIGVGIRYTIIIIAVN